MTSSDRDSRRDFLRKLAASSAFAAFAPAALPSVAGSRTREIPRRSRRPDPPNDRIQIATIGTGIIGFIDTRTALEVPGVELVAAADCYDARLTHVKEVFGDHVFTTRDYRTVLERSDVDAVIIATPDHWHAQIARDAMRAGKDVYCEKPMVHDLEEGPRMIETQEATGRVLQVGSQFASSVVYGKAKQLYESGAIGELNMIEARYNRNSSLGAWQYSIPPHVSPEVLDWERFLGDAPDHAFDPVRFFRWRNYWDYGTGVAGDLFVHLFTGIHHVLSASGPTRVASMGGLRYWNDGREVPDVHVGLYDYPDTESHPPFTLVLQSNLADGSGGGSSFRFIGSEGVMTIGWNGVTIERGVRRPPSLEALVEGYNSVRTFSEDVQEDFIEAYEARTAEAQPNAEQARLNTSSQYTAPEGYDDRLDHFEVFFEAMRTGGSVLEDAAFGYRAAAPALLTNLSYRNDRTYRWDPEAMRVVGDR